jgi:hypothetical protein
MIKVKKEFMKGDTINVYSIDFYRKNIKGFLNSYSRLDTGLVLHETFEVINTKGIKKISYVGDSYPHMRVNTCRIVLIEKLDYIKINN